MSDWGQRLKTIRTAGGFTQPQMARLLGNVTVFVVCRWESGRFPVPAHVRLLIKGIEQAAALGGDGGAHILGFLDENVDTIGEDGS